MKAISSGLIRRPAAARRALQCLLLLPVVRFFCRPLRVTGAPVANLPAIFVANHSSHADTGVVIAALPRHQRERLAPAAAEDYFFTSRLRAGTVRCLAGAFPFPRRGSEGLRRAERLLATGRSVLLFPEGTRSVDGRIGPFKGGIGRLAAAGYPVIPVAISGTGTVLPKGRRIARRAGVTVVFGPPLYALRGEEADELARRVETEVKSLHEDIGAPPRPATLYERAARFANRRLALALAFAWGVAEALWWPVVPDFLVAPLVLASPRRALLLAGAAVVGSVTGGTIAYLAGPSLLDDAPLVTMRMIEEARALLAQGGATALWHQPLSGIPYKVFALQAAPHAELGAFAFTTALARGARIVAVALFFAGGHRLLRRSIARLYGPLMALYATGFALGFARVVSGWR